MINRSLRLSVLFAGLLLATVPALSQSADVLHKLHARYDSVSQFDDGLAVVKRGDRAGYVDTTGRLVIGLDLDHAIRFSNGRAVVGKGSKRAMIDRAGRLLTPLEWDHIGNVDDGVAVAYKKSERGRNYALIDTLGNVMPLEHTYCSDFHNGYAVAGVGVLTVETVHPEGLKPREMVSFEGKYGYITPDGRWAIPAQFDEAKKFGENGLAPVGIKGKYYVKWGFVDRQGEVAIPCGYYSVEYFERDRAVVGKVVGPNKLAYGYIDCGGREVIPCRYDEATGFEFENTWVGEEKEGEMGYMLIDTLGNPVLSYPVLGLRDGGKYGQAVCAIRDGNGRLRYGLLSNRGRLILPFDYDEITIFSEWDPIGQRWKEAGFAVKDGVSRSFDLSKRR